MKNITLFFLLLLFANKVFAQNDTTGNTNLQERIFVHTDNNFYTTGEIIWFAVYVFDAQHLMPFSSSKTAYMELISPDNESIIQQKIELDSARGEGSVYLPLDMASGNYILSFYTSWMKNYGKEIFYSQPITIVNPFEKLRPSQLYKSESKIDIQYFPEGGELVYGLKSKVGVKVADENQKGIDFKGFLLNNKNDTLQSFTSLKFGMGNFSITPQNDQKYHLLIKLPDSTYKVNISDIQERGIVMSIQSSSENVKLKASKTEDLFFQSYTLKITDPGENSTQYVHSFHTDSSIITIPLSELPPGVSKFGIYNSDGILLAERLYFNIYNDRIEDITISTDRKAYGRRQKVKLNFSKKNKISGNYSMAVYRLDSLSGFSQNDIIRHFYLQSLLNGKVESPEYYFDESRNDRLELAENLMLTQGWRKVIRSVPEMEHLPEIESQMIQFKISDAQSNPIAGEKAYLTIPGNNFEFHTSVSDASGNLNFMVNHFYGNKEVALSLQRDTNYNITYTSPYYSNFKNDQEGIKLNNDALESLKERSLNMQVQNVFAKDQLVKITVPSANLPFYGEADKIYVLDDYTRFTTMQEVLIEFIPEVQLRKRRGDYHLKVYEMPFARFFDGKPLILLNGIPVKDPNKIIQTDPLRIEKIEVVARKFLWGSSYFEGIISYIGYPGEEFNKPLEDVEYRKEIEGYEPERIFYSPKYENDIVVDNTPDYRSLLYWKAGLKLSSKKQIEFFTGDRAGKYMINLQGVDEAGNFSSSNFFFEVNGTNTSNN